MRQFIFQSLVCFSPFMAYPNEPNVVVIGGGFAGLSAAYHLQQEGIPVSLYEARNRVGGRVLSARLDSTVVELGGQNIYDGGEAHTFLRFIDEFQLDLTHHSIPVQHHFYENGTLSPPVDYNKKFSNPDTLWQELEEASQGAQNMKELLLHFFEEEDPLYRTLAVRLAGYEGGSVENLSTTYITTLYYMLLGGISSCHQEEVVDLVSIEGGNSLLAEKLAESLDVHLEMPLRKVSKNQNGSYTLSFQNQETVVADILILAIPCSVYEDILFEPEVIPDEKLKAIQSIRYGSNGKIIQSFPIPSSERKISLNDHMGCFSSNNRDIFTFYYTGKSAHFSKETIEEIYRGDWEMLQQIFKETPLPWKVPEIARDALHISYEGAIGYSWPNDPFAKGTYAYISPGQEKLMQEIQMEGEEKVKSLFAPIDQRLFFAGEHTSILFDVPGTMEAALESGERIARILTKNLRGYYDCSYIE